MARFRYSGIFLIISLLLIYSPLSSAAESISLSLIEESDAFLQSQKFEQAMEKAISALDQSSSREEKALSMCAIAKIDLATSRDEHAWEYALEAEGIARDAHLVEALAKALLIKAQVCLYAEISPDYNRNDEGLSYLDEVFRITAKGDAVAERAMAYVTASQFYVSKNRWNGKNLDRDLYRRAGECLELAERLVTEHDLSDVNRVLFASRMRYYRQDGKYDEAISFCHRHIENCEPTDYLTLYQLYDHLTALELETGQEEKALKSHSNCVFNMQKYISQKADDALQEQETRYETALKQQIIRRRGYQLSSAILALLLLGTLAVLLVIRNRRIALQKEELTRQNQSKEQLLAFISRDFANPTNEQTDAIHRFAQECSRLAPEEIRERCEEFICGVQSLSNDVAQYVFNIIVSQKQAASSLDLSDREVEIIRLSAQGLSAAQIAEKLFLSTRTVSNHRQNIYSKMGVNSSAEMVSRARQAGIIKD